MKKSNCLKAIAVLLVLALSLGLTGCGQAELGYIGLYKEMMNQNLFEATGSMSIQINDLPQSWRDGAGKDQLAKLEKVLADYSLTYTSKVDYPNNLAEVKFFIKEQTTGTEREILSVTMKDDVCYIRIKEAVEFAKSFNDEDLNKQLDELFGDAEYLSLSNDELKQLSTVTPNAVTVQQTLDLNKQKEFALLWIDLLNNLATKTYDKYDSGLFEKNGNKYVLTIEAADLQPFVKTFATYTINNIEKLGPCLKTFISNLTEDQMARLGMNADMKLQALLGIDTMVAEVTTNRDKYLTNINTIDAATEEFNKFQGSKLISTLEKSGTNNYQADTTLQIKYADPNKEGGALDVALVAEESYRPCAGFTVETPAAGVLTMTELTEKMPTRISVNIDTGMYIKQQGLDTKINKIEVKMIDDYTYLPLRRLAEDLGETVGWDQDQEKAYVERNGERVYMTGLLINDLTFVKLRDFEKLGYTVEWNPVSMTATIHK